jgi:hypothetical protein
VGKFEFKFIPSPIQNGIEPTAIDNLNRKQLPHQPQIWK